MSEIARPHHQKSFVSNSNGVNSNAHNKTQQASSE